MKNLLKFLGVLAGVAALMLLAVWLRYGGGARFPDRSGAPRLEASALEVVADLDLPPGNIAVGPDERIFFSFHPEAAPEVLVAEWVDDSAVPYPSAEFQPGGSDPRAFQSVLSLRIDRLNRLWVLDYAVHGTGQPRLLGFDLASGEVVHQIDFPREIAPLGSHLNDFQVSPDGRHIYIADASIVAMRPGLIVVDLETGENRRLLEGHVSVEAEDFVPVVQGRKMEIFGLFAIRPGVDSIALDRSGEWLYFAAVTAQQMYRVRTSDLDDPSLSASELESRVETFAEKTMSDGITTDIKGNVYITDPENSAIHTLGPDGTLTTLLETSELRWPDGFSFGPGGWLYVTASALHHVIGRSEDHIRAHAPYQIYRFRPGGRGIPGH
jgi:sugar lactone lactonase YvrE